MRKMAILLAFLSMLALAFTVEEGAAPDTVVALMKAQLEPTVELLTQDGVWLGWEAATARVTYYPLTTQVAYDVYVPDFLMDNLSLVATVWGDHVYNPRLELRLGNGAVVAWSLDPTSGADPFYLTNFPQGARTLVGRGEIETIFANVLPQTYARLVRGAPVASR